VASTCGFEAVPGTVDVSELVWFVVLGVDGASLRSDRTLFNCRPNPGFLRDLGLAGALPDPHLLKRTNRFDQALGRVMRRGGKIDLDSARLPFLLALPRVGLCRVRVTSPRLYPGIAAFRVYATPTERASLKELRLAQQADQERPLRELIEWSCGLVQSLQFRHIPPVAPATVRPGIRLTGYSDLRDPSARRELVATVIRDEPDRLAQHVVDSVWAKNSHNKWVDTVVLLDRQGFLFASEQVALDDASRTRLRRSSALYELALVTMVRAWPGVAGDDPQSTEFDEAVRKLAHSPDAAFRATTSSKGTWVLAAEEFQVPADFVPPAPRKSMPVGSVITSVVAALIVAALLGLWSLVR
jgi:hypothetical protein